MSNPAPNCDIDPKFESATYKKVMIRIIPLLLLCYTVSFLDRINVGFAKLQMVGDLKFSNTIYGIGAGIFFLGYFIFEVPSNLILHKVGARRWIARIMISWGIVSAATMFVSSANMFYTMRFLLGVAEAGFFPGIILYLTYWFPAKLRGSIMALFMAGVPLAGIIGGPVSGAILHGFSGTLGLAGWQWLFLLEGIPSCLVGFLVLRYLDDRISDAIWLNADEKDLLKVNLARDSDTKQSVHLLEAFLNPRVWLLCLIYFCVVMGVFGIGFWMPTIIRTSGVNNTLYIGLLSSIPNVIAAIGMILVGWSADRHDERRWHFAIPCILGSLGMFISIEYAHNATIAIIALSITTAGVFMALPIFWAIPTRYLGGIGAAGGVALINSTGNIAGFVSPFMMGKIKDLTHSINPGLYVLASSLLLAGLLVFIFPPRVIKEKLTGIRDDSATRLME